MERHFTATVYILEEQKVLLVYHRKINKWLPAGGHVEPNETPAEAAIREALEETGLEIELFYQENIWVDRWNAKSIERPYMCLLENIPAHKEQPEHQHIDFVYVARPIGGKITHNEEELDGIKWFTLEEIEALEPDVEIFAETQQVLRQLFVTTFCCPNV